MQRLREECRNLYLLRNNWQCQGDVVIIADPWSSNLLPNMAMAGNSVSKAFYNAEVRQCQHVNLPVVLVGNISFLVHSLHLVNDLLKVTLIFLSTLCNYYRLQVSFLLDKLHRLTC